MRLLHVVCRLDAARGGAPAAAANMASALQSEGHDVTIATTVRDDDSREVGQLVDRLADGVVVERFRRSGLPYDHSHQLGRWLRASLRDFDLVEIHGVFDYPCWKTSQMARASRTPLLIHAHGSLDPFDLQKHRQAKMVVGPTVVRRMLHYASAVMVTTAREGAEMNTFGARATIRAIPLPYRASQYVGDGDRFRQTFAIPEGPIVLFLGRIDYKKGLERLVHAAGDLSDAGLRLTLVLGGDPSSEYARRLKADVARRSLERVVVFPGHLGEADKADALAAASLFTLVSDNENYGLVLVEAARAGLPLLISDQVYLEQELRTSGSAHAVARDHVAIAEAMRALLESPERLDAMSTAARKVANDLFDWVLVAAEQSRFRNELLRARASGVAP